MIRWSPTGRIRRAALQSILSPSPPRTLRSILTGPLFPMTIFAIVSLSWAASIGLSGFDAWLYREGAVAFLAGGDPWLAGTDAAHFAGSPLSVLAFVPAALLPEQLFRWGFVMCSGLLLAYALRHRKVYWVYPPTVLYVLGGNPGGLMVALLMLDSTWTRGLAVSIKSYAALPAIGERAWRGLALAAALALVSVVLVPDLWLRYLHEFPTIASRLGTETSHGGTIYEAPQLIPVAILALLYLARVDFRAAAWLAIPALWPAHEYSDALLLAPIVGPWTALIPVVWPMSSGATLAVIAYAAMRFIRNEILPRRAAVLAARTTVSDTSVSDTTVSE